MKIYTKTGDQGKTRLIGGREIDKTDPRLESYGTVDELNSHIGVALSALPADQKNAELRTNLVRIQNELFNLGSWLACEDRQIEKSLPLLLDSHLEQLESEIDQMTEKLTPLKHFILPGGSPAASQLHVARTVCRRAERRTAKLLESEAHYQLALKYLNRLSDYLFVAARFANFLSGISDQHWQKQ